MCRYIIWRKVRECAYTFGLAAGVPVIGEPDSKRKITFTTVTIPVNTVDIVGVIGIDVCNAPTTATIADKILNITVFEVYHGLEVVVIVVDGIIFIFG